MLSSLFRGLARAAPLAPLAAARLAPISKLAVAPRRQAHTPGAIAPHGGTLVNLLLEGESLVALKEEALKLPSLTLNERQLCDIELLMNGGFSPLQGFMNSEQHSSVLKNLRLPNGTLWPIPVVLDSNKDFIDKNAVKPGMKLALRDPEGDLLAVLDVNDVWQRDKEAEVKAIFDTTDEDHWGVFSLRRLAGDYCIGGAVRGAQLPIHYDYLNYRLTPLELRKEFDRRGWQKIVALHSRNPLHRAHMEMTLRAAHQVGANVLLSPVTGPTQPGDVDHYTRVKCYQEVLPRFPDGMALFHLLPLSMRMGGPREALWHAIVRKNFGATHFIVGVHHAGAGEDKSGRDFYGPYASMALCKEYESELGVGIVTFKRMVYVPDKNHFYPNDKLPAGAIPLMISGDQLRQRLRAGEEVPEWFTFPAIVAHLRRAYPPRRQQGFTVFFTGLSGSGKSTIANALVSVLLEEGSRRVTLLDGDVVRTNLSSELTFSKEHRDLNIRRIGYVASEISKNGGVAICAPIAPYHKARLEARKLVEEYGGFVLVHVSTPLDECARRDRKGLYAKAMKGLLKGMTGVDDPYETPKDAHLSIDTTHVPVSESVKIVMAYLRKEGFLAPEKGYNEADVDRSL